MDRVADGQVPAELQEDGTSTDDVTRPAPLEPVADRLRAWLGWFGLGRVVVSAVSMVIVCAGAFWLVRSPPPPAEAVLAQATSIPAPLATLAGPGADPGRADDKSSGDAGASAAQSANDGDAVPEGADVMVHVAGAVMHPGVYRLLSGDRVDDAIAAAGGPTAGADVDALNLAATVADGVRVYVPEEGEVVEPLPALLVPSMDATGAPVPVGLVDINRAGVGQLDVLPGVGPATATAIVAERERNGPYLTVDDLERVPGIGPAKLAGLRDLVSV